METDKFFHQNKAKYSFFCLKLEEKTHGFNKNKTQFVENCLNSKAWVITSFSFKSLPTPLQNESTFRSPLFTKLSQ